MILCKTPRSIQKHAKHLRWSVLQVSERHSEPCQTSKVEVLRKSLTAKRSILDFWDGSKCFFETNL